MKWGPSAGSTRPTRSAIMSQQGKLRVRRESLQRIQIGLAGLAGVLLIVILSNIVINAARPDITATDDNAIQQSAIVAGAANGAASDAASPGENGPFAYILGPTPPSGQAIRVRSRRIRRDGFGHAVSPHAALRPSAAP